MKRTIKLNSVRSLTFDDENKKVYESIEEWKAEGKRRFGDDLKAWKYVCPMCGHVASVQDFINAGVSEDDALNGACQECLGRHTGKGAPKKGDSSGCNWAAYGFFGIYNGKGCIVITVEGKGAELFDFAEEE